MTGPIFSPNRSSMGIAYGEVKLSRWASALLQPYLANIDRPQCGKRNIGGPRQ